MSSLVQRQHSKRKNRNSVSASCPKMQRQYAIAAYHEAGHAVVAHMLGTPVHHVSIAADGGGLTRHKRPAKGERAVLILLAGPYAQKRFAPRSDWRSRSHTGRRSDRDFDKIVDLIYDMHGEGKVAEAYWRYVEAKAEALVEQYWSRIEAVAKALLERGEIIGDIRSAFPALPFPVVCLAASSHDL